MRRRVYFHLSVFIFTIIFLPSCNLPPAVEPVATIVPPPANTSIPTPTEISPTPTPIAFLPPAPETVALDFVALTCSAKWSNNAYHIPCPGHLDEIERGYVEYSDHAVAEGMVSVEAPLISMLPGQGDGNGIGLFGRYPPLTIYPGDFFQATLACHGDSPCNAEFALEYFDQSGNYTDTDWSWTHQAGDSLEELSVDLSSLAGQTVELMLVMREKGSVENNWFLLIRPHISRDPQALPAPTVVPTSTPELTDKTPGVISGKVDMSTSPPYLTDPVSNPQGMPVVVTFFNLDDSTYWYIQTLLTGHPNYQMTIPPGRYEVVAYARGVGGEPYVTAGYTGQNPSCGQPLRVVEVTPNERVENIIIADWNWKCGGTAFRPEKPPIVPVP